MYRILLIGSVIVGLTVFSSLSISAQTVETSTVVEDGSASSSPVSPDVPEKLDLVDALPEDSPSSELISEAGPSSTKPKEKTVDEKLSDLERTVAEQNVLISKYAKRYDACRFTANKRFLVVPAADLWSR